MNARQKQFHHFINEFNYLYQQTKTVSLPPSLPLHHHHLLYPTVLFLTMTFYPQTRVIKEQGHSKLKAKCDRLKMKINIKIAHLVSSLFGKTSGVQRVMSMVCQHIQTHIHSLQLCSRNSPRI